MKNTSGKFSLRETLQIVIPGVYFIGLLYPLVSEVGVFVIKDSTEMTDLIISSILSLLAGMLIYSLDLPKKLWFFNMYLPTTLITKNMGNDKSVHNKYFQFYDDKISDKQKDITEKYTSIYHFSVNIAITSLILTIIYLIIYKEVFLNSYGLFTLLILIVSILLTYQIFFGDRKIKYMFKRQYDKFIDSINSSS